MPTVSTHASSDSCCQEQCCYDEYSCQGYLAARSQASDTARRLIGTHHYTDTHNIDEFTQVLSITTAYARSFNTEKLGKYFSPVCNSACFTLGADRKADVRAEDFGLSCSGVACLEPKSSNFIADIQYYLGLDPICEGLFLTIYAPIVYNSRRISCCASSKESCGSTFEACLMSLDSTKVDTGTTNITTALNGSILWGDLEHTMNFGKLCCQENVTRLADLQAEIGYNYWMSDTAYCGIKLIAKAPTGNRAQGRMIFEPIAGNGGHVELGGGLQAYWRCWEKDTDHFISTHIELDVTHLFTTNCQKRVFDLNNGCNIDPSRCFSRYLLLKEFSNDGTSLVGLERGPNVFAQNLTVRIPVQVDITWLLSYQYTCWLADFGYNFWGQSEEEIMDFLPNVPGNTYAIKGILPMCSTVTGAPNTRTASRSTINTTRGIEGETDGPVSTFINCADINTCSALAPSARSNSAVLAITYLWNDYKHEPWLGIGAKIEVGSTNSALDQWTLWAKGGISF
ncbi:MAG: hypothetical protein WD068_00990 [Candidatus Babeliales bacterium]